MGRFKAKAKAITAPNMLGVLIKAAAAASVASLLLIVLFAAAMWQQWLGAEAIPAINAAIKVIGAAIAGLIAQRRCAGRAWLWGAAAGLIYTAIAFLIFSILADSFRFNAALFSDAGIGALAGMLSAMVARVIGK